MHLATYEMKGEVSKCQVARNEVTYLGFNVTEEGIRKNQEKIERTSS